MLNLVDYYSLIHIKLENKIIPFHFVRYLDGFVRMLHI